MESKIEIQCDGSSLTQMSGKKGKSGAGILVLRDEIPIAELGFHLGARRNSNQSEFLAVYCGVKFCFEKLTFNPEETTLLIKTDSLYVIQHINQLKENLQIKEFDFIRSKTKLIKMIQRLKEWSIHYQHWEDTDPPHLLAKAARKRGKDFINWLSPSGKGE